MWKSFTCKCAYRTAALFKMQSEPQREGVHGGGMWRGPPVYLVQDSWVVAVSPVESVVLSPGTIVKQDGWYLKIHRKCFLSQRHNCYDSEK